MPHASRSAWLSLALALSTAAADGSRIAAYRNPVIPGFHPDPSVVRVGEWFYLANSSCEFFPGVPLHRSRDLVNWELIGHALTRDSQLPLARAEPSRGIFAPTLRHHRGTYYVITTNVSDRGNFLVTARDPAGPWSEPIWIPEQGGIDPSLFFDDDGTAYLTSTGGGSQEKGIWQSVIDVASGRLLSSPRLVWMGTGGRYPEGPHLYRIGGRYYLMISEGGTEYGHRVTIARSASPWGPFEACPRNPILTHQHTEMDQPVQGTGHADLVEDREGNWWMVFLAFRPVGGGYWHHLGRETFLAPVRWDEGGWPIVNEGQPIALDMRVRGLPEHKAPMPPLRDEFDGPLGSLWNHVRNPLRESYSTTDRPGWLVLRASQSTLADQVSPTFVGRRQQHLRMRAATRIDLASGPTAEAGLVLYHDPHHRYELGVRNGRDGREVFVRQTIGARLSTVTASAGVRDTGPLVLQVEAEPEEYTLSFGSSLDDLTVLDRAATRYLSSEVAGGFVGTYVGLYAAADGDASPDATAAFDWFDYEPRGGSLSPTARPGP